MKIYTNKKDRKIAFLESENNKLCEENECLKEQLKKYDIAKINEQMDIIDELKECLKNEREEIRKCKEEYQKLIAKMKESERKALKVN